MEPLLFFDDYSNLPNIPFYSRPFPFDNTSSSFQSGLYWVGLLADQLHVLALWNNYLKEGLAILFTKNYGYPTIVLKRIENLL